MTEHLTQARTALNQQRVSEAIALLQCHCGAQPADAGAVGLLAWLHLGTGDLTAAEALYRKLEEVQPENPEPGFWLLRIRTLRDGPTAETVRAMHVLARRCSGVEEVWKHLSDASSRILSARERAALHAEAMRLFPRSTNFRTRLIEAQQEDRRGRRGRLFAALGGQRLARYLLRSSGIRKLLLDTASDADELVRVELETYFQRGSVRSSFPQSPEWMRPENFDAYFKGTLPGWWKWFRDNMPVAEPRGLRLADIGAGPGFIGHHFLAAGFDVTAISGNPSELEECRRRGMTTIEAEMHAIPVASGTFDAVLTSHVLEHSIVPFLLLREVRRILKPGGHLFVNLPVPIDGNVADDFPDAYDPETDTFDFKVDPITCNVVEQAMSYYSHGVMHHVFVLTYWQWRWLSRLTGFEHLASAFDVCATGEVLTPQEEAAREDLRKAPRNQLFILRRKEEGEPQSASAKDSSQTR